MNSPRFCCASPAFTRQRRERSPARVRMPTSPKLINKIMSFGAIYRCVLGDGRRGALRRFGRKAGAGCVHFSSSFQQNEVLPSQDLPSGSSAHSAQSPAPSASAAVIDGISKTMICPPQKSQRPCVRMARKLSFKMKKPRYPLHRRGAPGRRTPRKPLEQGRLLTKASVEKRAKSSGACADKAAPEGRRRRKHVPADVAVALFENHLITTDSKVPANPNRPRLPFYKKIAIDFCKMTTKLCW